MQTHPAGAQPDGREIVPAGPCGRQVQ
jgi:hypothetical protein